MTTDEIVRALRELEAENQCLCMCDECHEGDSIKIEHVARYVNDLEGARNFFVKYFGAASNDGYCNPETNYRS